MPKQNNDDYLNNEANLSIYADHLGLTPQYVRDNKLKLKNIEDQIKQSLISINKYDNCVVYINIFGFEIFLDKCLFWCIGR